MNRLVLSLAVVGMTLALAAGRARMQPHTKPEYQSGGDLLFRVGALATLTTLLLTLVCTSAAWATTFTVTNTNDSGTGSLRAAIKQANANAGADEIVFADSASGTIILASPLPDVTDAEGLAIDGGGDVTVSGNEAVGIVRVYAKLVLRNLTLVKGAGFPESIGATDRQGGAIYNAYGPLKITNATLSDNRLTGFSWPEGGAIYNLYGTLTVTNSTFSGNDASYSGSGGAIHNFDGMVNVTNSTFLGNSATSGYGGAIANRNDKNVTVTNSTFSGNSAGTGGAIYKDSGTLTVSNSILANNTATEFGGNCYALDSFESPIRDGGYNIEDSGTSCGFTEATGSLSNTNPLLDPAGLQDNGGPTQTIALQPDSPAVDLVGQGACPPPTTDQRGIERPQGAACDSGAFELEEPDSTPPSVTSTSPKANATEVAPTANVRATFSEEMDSTTIDGTTFKLFKKGTTTQIPATVSYNAGTDTAKLDPTNNLRRGVAYKAVVTTWATDGAGNRLDQDRSTSGFQQMRWFFRVDD